MTLIEAINKMDDNQAITCDPEPFGKYSMYMVPTDTPNCCELYWADGTFVSSRWNPKRKDLISNKWRLIDRRD